LKKSGFTLIELLIVVAIIGILAAIAVPNFLNAQIRAKVTRMYADHRTLVNAMMMYRLDMGTYHAHSHSPAQHVPLTTPMAYLNIWPVDVFQENLETTKNPQDKYAKMTIHWEPYGATTDADLRSKLVNGAGGYAGQIISLGPSRTNNGAKYDPENGLFSDGLLVTDVPGHPLTDYKWPPGTY